MKSEIVRQLLMRFHAVEVGMHSYGFLRKDALPRGTIIGRYTSIAEGLKIFRRNHPLDTFSTHPYFYNSMLGYVKLDTIPNNDENPLVIGNDVWIGANVTILPGCRIVGNGAVIGAGAVVTSDVEPFSVIAGNPAKEIGQRDVEKAMHIQGNVWWEMEPLDILDVINNKSAFEANGNGYGK
ncbi:CatB-related O-acetyltransferase [Neptuniibacter caesariensis]|uniref:Chloramphenicol acetyltransferase n=1 Tax=Neptuniibacter caesariensis TaxID=207954 RepID=A0A7U8GR81_NEPCE|nr:CatB-related O-acetyltransferase [Neptuniibacter caesariensis]EAR59932.1 hypothetical protein MED92_16015 [Oceanospirillum sp. MED92] [Neptuniibacter caesariensis]